MQTQTTRTVHRDWRLASLAAALILVWVAVWVQQSRPSGPESVIQPVLPGQQIWKNGTSSFLFGTNDTYEWSPRNIETVPAIQDALRRAGFTLIRSFFPDNASDAVIEQRIKTIQNAGAQCLGVITNIDNASFDEHLVRSLADRCRMYEFGNESDYNGISVEHYLKAWNTEIPRLRQIAPNAVFIGPVTYNDQGNHNFMAEFLLGVKTSGVLPGAISFHWYPCWNDTQQSCLVKATSFGQVATDVRAEVRAILGKDLPIGITEWNYDAGNPPPSYGDNADFITSFTTLALHSMADAGVAFASQFDAASYSGYGRLDMFDLETLQPKPQYYAAAGVIEMLRPSSGTATAAVAPGVTSPISATASPNPGGQNGTNGPLLSRGKPVNCSANNSGPQGADALVDGHYGNWAFWQLAASDLPGWCAIHIGAGPSRVLVEWVSDYNTDYVDDTGAGPQDYTLLVSGDSTNGSDGTWQSATVVAGNHARVREHLIPFAGKSWLKMSVASGQPRASQPYVRIDEVDVFDASAGPDAVFFSGDSVTALSYRRTDAQQPSFAVDVHNSYPQRFPAMLNGGMGGWNSDGAVQYMPDWLGLNPDVKYWLLEWGSNDALQQMSPAHFQANLQNLVDQIKGAGHVPVLAHIPFSTFQHRPDLDAEIRSLNAVVDQVTKSNGLMPGPDLYSLIRQHPEYLSDDGLHPNDAGAVALNAAWFQALKSSFGSPVHA